MSKHYSPSKRAFYSFEVHTAAQIPSDTVEISDEEWKRLLHCQGMGRQIAPHPQTGIPMDVDPVFAPELLETVRRSHRDAILKQTDGIIARHRDERDAMDSMGGHTTLTHEQFKGLLWYRQTLRDLPTHPQWPNVDVPTLPEFAK